MLLVKMRTGKDLREIGSGRTGGTNAMRAAGYGIGLLTVLFDLLKASGAVWLARWMGGGTWLEVLAPLCTILGHNYSIFLIHRGEDKKMRLHGGAGGTPTLGGAFGLWAPCLLYLLPMGALVFFGIGYASVATMSMGVFITVLFGVRAYLGLSPWQYLMYGVIAEGFLLWSLRPNIRRLLDGTERPVSWREKKQGQKQE